MKHASFSARRADRARRWVLIAGASAVGAAVIAGVEWRSRQTLDTQGALAPELRAQNAATIAISSAAGALTVSKRGEAWVLRERDGRSTPEARVRQFLEDVSRAQLGRAMTRDPVRWDRLGLGDPAQGGAGVRVQILDARGAQLADFTMGFPEGDGVFVRRGADPQAYRLIGALNRPDRVGAWVDLAIVTIARERVRSVDVRPPIGPAYRLERATPGASFALAAPFDGLAVIAPVGISATAHALISAQITDITPSSSVTGALAASARLETFDGVSLTAEGRVSGERIYLRFAASGVSPQSQTEAARINAAAQGWDYLVSDLDARTIFAPLDTLARYGR